MSHLTYKCREKIYIIKYHVHVNQRRKLKQSERRRFNQSLQSMVSIRAEEPFAPCSLRRWKRGDPSRLFLNELSRVLQWAELEEAILPLPPGLEGGVRASKAPPPPSTLEAEDEEEEEGGGVDMCWIWCTGVLSGVGSGESSGVTCDTGGGVADELEEECAFLDLKTDGDGKLKKRGMGERSGEGDGDGERGVWRGRDFMEWSWGRSVGPFEGRV